MAEFIVRGVERASEKDTTLVIDADTAANAKVKAELRGVIVTSVVDRDEEEAGGRAGGAAPRSGGEPDRLIDAQPVTEGDLWAATPSQWIAFKTYAVCAFVAFVIVVVGFFFWPLLILLPIVGLVCAVQYVLVGAVRYQVSSERLTITRGLLSKHIDEVELFRVKDSELHQSFISRLVGIGDVILQTTDATTPVVEMCCIASPDEVRETIRKQSHEQRRRRGVREIDVE